MISPNTDVKNIEQYYSGIAFTITQLFFLKVDLQDVNNNNIIIIIILIMIQYFLHNTLYDNNYSRV